MRFPYIKFPSKDPKRKWISRPLVPIKLTGPKGVWEGYALVDSGADKSIFNLEIAELIGLQFNRNLAEKFSGIEGGVLESISAKVKLQVIGAQEIEILAGFVQSHAVSAILGQEGFFDAFRIKFERDHGIFEVIQITK